MFVAAGVATMDGDLGFGDMKMVGEQLDKGLVGGAINWLFSEVNGEFCDVLRICHDKRAAF